MKMVTILGPSHTTTLKVMYRPTEVLLYHQTQDKELYTLGLRNVCCVKILEATEQSY